MALYIYRGSRSGAILRADGFDLGVVWSKYQKTAGQENASLTEDGKHGIGRTRTPNPNPYPFRDPSAERILTLEPKVCNQYSLLAVWIPRVPEPTPLLSSYGPEGIGMRFV